MKLRVTYIAMLIVLSINSFAQNSQELSKSAFIKGSSSASFGIGVGEPWIDYYGSPSTLPLLSFSIDRCIAEDIGPGAIGVGPFLGYKNASYDYGTNYKANWHDIIVAVRATYHLTILKDKNNHFDPYAGVTLGARYTIYNDTYYDYLGYTPYSYNNFNFVRGLFAGAKYNFSRNFGVFAEFGWDVNYFRCGINLNTANK